MGMERSDVFSPYFVKDKLREVVKLIDERMLSAARNNTKLALAMVRSHHPKVDLRGITKDLATTDEARVKLAHVTMFKMVVPYACRVARLADLKIPFLKDIPVLPRSDGNLHPTRSMTRPPKMLILLRMLLHSSEGKGT